MTAAVQLLAVLALVMTLAFAVAFIVARYHRALAARAESRLRIVLLDLAHANAVIVTEGMTLDEIELDLRARGVFKPRGGGLAWSQPVRTGG